MGDQKHDDLVVVVLTWNEKGEQIGISEKKGLVSATCDTGATCPVISTKVLDDLDIPRSDIKNSAMKLTGVDGDMNIIGSIMLKITTKKKIFNVKLEVTVMRKKVAPLPKNILETTEVALDTVKN